MGKQWEQWQTLFLGGSKITEDGDCSHEIKRRLLLGRKVMTNLLLLLLLSCFSHVRLCATPRQQPTRLRCFWDSPGKNTGVGCHFLLQCIKVKMKSLSCVQLFVTLWNVACQAPLSMGFSRQKYRSGVPCPSPGDLPCISCIADRLFTHLATWEAHIVDHLLLIFKD